MLTSSTKSKSVFKRVREFRRFFVWFNSFFMTPPHLFSLRFRQNKEIRHPTAEFDRLRIWLRAKLVPPGVSSLLRCKTRPSHTLQNYVLSADMQIYVFLCVSLIRSIWHPITSCDGQILEIGECETYGLMLDDSLYA